MKEYKKHELAKNDEDFRRSQQESFKTTVDSAGKFFEGGKRVTWAGATYLALGAIIMALLLFFIVSLYFGHEGSIEFVSQMESGFSGSSIICSDSDIEYKVSGPEEALEFKELFPQGNCFLRGDEE